MSHWTTKAHELVTAQARLIADLAREPDTVTMKPARGATPAGDSRKLRGIPAIGRNVSGAIPQTNPEHSIGHDTPNENPLETWLLLRRSRCRRAA